MLWNASKKPNHSTTNRPACSTCTFTYSSRLDSRQAEGRGREIEVRGVKDPAQVQGSECERVNACSWADLKCSQWCAISKKGLRRVWIKRERVYRLCSCRNIKELRVWECESWGNIRVFLTCVSVWMVLHWAASEAQHWSPAKPTTHWLPAWYSTGRSLCAAGDQTCQWPEWEEVWGFKNVSNYPCSSQIFAVSGTICWFERAKCFTCFLFKVWPFVCGCELPTSFWSSWREDLMRSRRAVSCFFSSSWVCLIWGKNTQIKILQIP